MSRAPRRWFWSAVVVALAVTAVGTGLALAGIMQAGRVESTVEDYFAAVAQGRAAGALALGAIPDGDRSYLTQAVLDAQRDVGRISHLDIGTITRTGTAAAVDVSYRLSAGGASFDVLDTVHLDKFGWRWRMAAVATPVSMTAETATSRVALAGTALPTVPVLMFPGSLPLQTNSDLLGLDREQTVVRFAAPGPVEVAIAVPPAGRTAVAAALDAALTSCLAAANDDPNCPTTVQGVRFVPGSMTGSLTQAPSVAGVTFTVLPDVAGRILVTGTFQAQAQWKQLNFNNLSEAKAGELTLSYQATILAVDPIRVQWGAP